MSRWHVNTATVLSAHLLLRLCCFMWKHCVHLFSCCFSPRHRLQWESIENQQFSSVAQFVKVLISNSTHLPGNTVCFGLEGNNTCELSPLTADWDVSVCSHWEQRAESRGHYRRVWGLWLTFSSLEHWAAEGLSAAGGSELITHLLIGLTLSAETDQRSWAELELQRF